MYAAALPCLLINAGRIPTYTREQLLTLVRDMVSIPLATDMQPVVADALKRLDPSSSSSTDAKNDTATLRDLLSTPTALRNLPPEVILQLPVPLVQLIWRTVPPRRLIDMSYLLHQVDTDTMAAGRPMHVQDLSARPAIKAVREAAVQRRKSTPVQRLCAFTRGAQDLYHSLCTLIGQHFERTHDAKWATLRTDIYLVNQDPDVLKAGSKQLAAAGQQSTRPGALRDLPADPLAAVLEEMERILNTTERGSMETLLNLVRKAFEQRSDGRSAVDVPRTVQEQIVSIANALFEQASSIVDAGKTAQKASDFFCRPVVDLHPGIALAYCAAIERPMDLGTIRVNARAGQYKSLDELERDVKLIGENCRNFNQKSKDLDYLFRLTALIEQKYSSLVSQERKQNATAISRQQQPADKNARTAPELLSEPSGIVQLLMIMSEPFLVRHCLHVVMKGLYSSAREGVPLTQQGGEVLAALRVLAIGDIAQSRPPRAVVMDPNGKVVLDESLPAPSAGSFYFYDALTRAAREVLYGGSLPRHTAAMAAPSGHGKAGSASSDAQQAASTALPLTLRAALVSLQTAFMEYMLLRSGQAVPGLDGQQAGTGAPRTTALQALHALRRGAHVHGRTVSLLCLSVAISGSEVPMPHTALALGYMLDLLKTALPPDSNADVGPEPALLLSCIPAFLRCAAAGKQSTGAADGASPFHAFLTESQHAIGSLIRPALKLSSSIPHVRSLYHYAFANLLRAFADLPTVPADRAYTRVLSAETCRNLVLMALTTAVEGRGRVAQGVHSGTAAGSMQVEAAEAGSALVTQPMPGERQGASRAGNSYNAALEELVEAGLVSTLSLIWTRPDFDAARRAYLLLVGSISPYLPAVMESQQAGAGETRTTGGRFPWGSIGLSPLQSAAVSDVKLAGQSSSGLPLPTPTGSLGHGFDTGAALYGTPMTPAGMSGGAHQQPIPHLAHAHAGVAAAAYSQPVSKVESPASYGSEDVTMRG